MTMYSAQLCGSRGVCSSPSTQINIPIGNAHQYYGSEDVEHVDGDFRLHWRNDTSSQGIDWGEIEANRFAAALLMPENLLKEDMNKCPTIDIEAVQRLASLYKVSRLAMQFRLINLGILPPDFDPSAA